VEYLLTLHNWSIKMCNMKTKQQGKGSTGLPAVAYYRVSTREQGQSGLGLEAQRRAVTTYCETHDYQIIDSYQDIESGKHNERPGLVAALEKARAEKATLLIAKLDRLSRNAAFVMTLRDAGVQFVACDLPEANTMTIGIMAILAQQERELISTRTKAALAELKAKGIKLGTDNLSDAARKKAAQAKREKALAFYNGALTHALNYHRDGRSLRWIAEQLNKSAAKTRGGGRFTATHVLRMLRMAGEISSGSKGVLDKLRAMKTAQRMLGEERLYDPKAYLIGDVFLCYRCWSRKMATKYGGPFVSTDEDGIPIIESDLKVFRGKARCSQCKRVWNSETRRWRKAAGRE
jgi:DNA invertase Pin-like site-specific DNA recombinase